MAARTILSLEEFLKLPEHEEDGTHYELDEGQLIVLPPPRRPHAFLMSTITTYLNLALDRKRFMVFCGDLGYLLDETEDRSTVRGADISIEEARPLEKLQEDDQVARGAPLVAIEIVSPSNRPGYLQRKVRQYLQAGAAEVWVVYPSTQETHVFRADTAEPEIYPRGQSFSTCTGITVDTERFFAR